jgi:hypothetical protein
MAFFTGTPEERAGDLTAERGVVLQQRDVLAQKMAARGRDLAMTSMRCAAAGLPFTGIDADADLLRWEDMRVYMFLLLLEVS